MKPRPKKRPAGAFAGRSPGRSPTGTMTATIVGRLQGEAEKSIVRSFLILFEYVLCVILGVLRLLVAPFVLGAALSYVPDGIWYLDEVSRSTLTQALWSEACSLSIFFGWLSLLQQQEQLVEEVGDPRLSPPMLGVSIGLAGSIICAWGPRASAVLYGILGMGGARRAQLHFAPLICWGASGYLLSCMFRAVWPPGPALSFGMSLAGLLIYFEVPLLGRTLSVKAQQELDTRRQELVTALGGQIPGSLLLSAVAPKTLLLYLESLARFFLWRSQDGSPASTTIGELDDSLGKWIQHCYDRWNSFETDEGRQLCVLGRCGLLLLRPRLTGFLRTSGKMLEAWKRVMPPVHYTPLPFPLFVLFVQEMFDRGETDMALCTWLTYHCILRPGEAILARVRDLHLPDTLEAIMQGEPGVIQARHSKRIRPARLSDDPDEVLRPRQVSLFDRALMVLLWVFVQGKDATAWLFPSVDGRRWRMVIQSCAEKFWTEMHRFVPRSLRPGGACHLHMDHGWPLPDLVMRGGWAKFESTHAYLSTGLYAAVSVGLLPSVKSESRRLTSSWPRGLRFPPALRGPLPFDLREKFAADRGLGWGMESATRSLGSGDGPTIRGPRRS